MECLISFFSDERVASCETDSKCVLVSHLGFSAEFCAFYTNKNAHCLYTLFINKLHAWTIITRFQIVQNITIIFNTYDMNNYGMNVNFLALSHLLHCCC